MPFFGQDSRTFDAYVKKHKTRTGLWSNFDKYFISLMKAYYGDAANPGNEWGFHWLPRVSGDHSHFGYWLDMVETETASFWYSSPEVERGELSPETIGTEVFLFPAAGTAEKSGTFTNTQRLLQHREKAVDPPGDARSETWFMVHLGRRLKARALQDTRTRNDGLRALTWSYAT